MKMVALKEFRYSGKQLLAGDSFEARDRDVRLLRAINNAKLAEGVDDPDAGGEGRQKGPGGPAKRTYKRRDMKAE
ncbi:MULTISPECIES: hypothetical protein [Pseudomonas]|uniref:Uncharacterized protein n=2 Tax=Pseudomonas putida TaxID=303 RepID=A0A8I1JL29_PSEPU|nr:MULTISPECIES: hypothetical protein [Pseudomonas]MBI6884005.1 hypothetical protein [Pseudomonas putida]MCX2816493.1 hypothetical protein [Pseudomonas sp. DCB_E]MCX9143098.1 hypothetical protein [Pseudomonas sp. DCB_Q]MDD2001519.1 hypothetical protein [Pseudomonas putida]PTV57970.1 hypothetical protein DBL05_15225 [Pseudomonas putida]